MINQLIIQVSRDLWKIFGKDAFFQFAALVPCSTYWNERRLLLLLHGHGSTVKTQDLTSNW